MDDPFRIDPSLLHRVQMEYLEMPGLQLTSTQARRLWNLDEQACEAILTRLVQLRFLAIAANGTYLRRRSGSVRIQLPSHSHDHEVR